MKIRCLAITLALLVASAKSLQIIGAGLSRTGTTSLRNALNVLGFSTYHVIEIIEGHRYDDFKYWIPYFRGDMNVSEFADYMYKDFTAATDFPTCNAWKELAVYYPEAKIILTHRASPELWWESLISTVLDNNLGTRIVGTIHPILRNLRKALTLMWVKELGLERNREPTFADREAALAFYERHNAEVKSYAPKRTLVFDVREGWEPLCAFLGKPIPSIPFPKANDRQEYRKRINIMSTVAAGGLLALVLGLIWAITWATRLFAARVYKKKQC